MGELVIWFLLFKVGEAARVCTDLLKENNLHHIDYFLLVNKYENLNNTSLQHLLFSLRNRNLCRNFILHNNLCKLQYLSGC